MRGPFQSGWYRRDTDKGTVVHKVVGHPADDGVVKTWLTCPFDEVQGGPCGGGGVLTPETWNAFKPAPEPRLAVD